jgi:hypothetical protein
MSGDTDVQQPLMLVMPVVPERLPALRTTLRALDQEHITRALDRVGTVHATRFVVLEDDAGGWAKLIVVATFDGSVEDYIAAFARELSREFNVLFGFVADTEDKPSPPVEDDVERFTRYVHNRNVRPANGRTYSAYPGLTALDIYEATRPRHDAAPGPGR